MSDQLDDFVYIFGANTISSVRERCRDKSGEYGGLENLLEQRSDFVLTSQRKRVLEDVSKSLSKKKSCSIVLYGSYGSGKTVLMNTICNLFEEGQDISGTEFNQIRYGDRPITPIKITLEEKDSIKKLLKEIIRQIISKSAITEDDIIELFNENKEEFDITEIWEHLPEERADSNNKTYDDPGQREEPINSITNLVRDLAVHDIHDFITWCTEKFKEVEKKYPAIYLDEMEQLAKPEEAIDEKNYDPKFQSVIQKMMRKASTGFENKSNPPHLLLVNSVELDQLRKEFPKMATDLTTGRIQEITSYNIDPTEEETVSLFRGLYIMYLRAILSEDKEKYSEWIEKLDSGEPYPFTEDLLRYVVKLVGTEIDEETGVSRVSAFRDYKAVLLELFKQWEGEGEIDEKFLYENGDRIRHRVSDETSDSFNISRFPGKKTVEDEIEKLSLDPYKEDLVIKVVEDSLLDSDVGSRAHFSKNDLEEIAESNQIDKNEIDFDELRNQLEETSYFEYEGQLTFYPYRIISEASSKSVSLENRVENALEEISGKTLIGLLGDQIEQLVQSKVTKKEPWIEIDSAVDYVNKVYVTIDDISEKLNQRSAGKGLELILNLNSADGDSLATFKVIELEGRAPNFTESLEGELNDKIRSHYPEEGNNNTKRLINTIERSQAKDKYHAYKKFLKLTAAGNTIGIKDELEEYIADNSHVAVDNIIERKESICTRNYATKVLGLQKSYDKKQYLSMSFAIHCLKKSGDADLSYDTREVLNFQDSNVQYFGQKSDPLNAGSFEDTVKEFEENEPFVAQGQIYSSFDERTLSWFNYIKGEFNNEAEIKFEEVVELIFGVKGHQVPSKIKQGIYMLLLAGDQDGRWEFDLSSNKVLSNDKKESMIEEKVRKRLKAEIKKTIVDEVHGNGGEKDVETLFKEYQEIEQLDDSRKENIIDDYSRDVQVDADLDEEFSKFYDSALPEEIEEYCKKIEKVFDQGSMAVYVFLPRLKPLTNELSKAKDALEKKEKLDGLCDKYKVLKGEEWSISEHSRNLKEKIDVIRSIRELESSSDVEKQIEKNKVPQKLDQLIEDASKPNHLHRTNFIENFLENTVPKFDEFESEKIKNSLEEDIENLRKDLESVVDEKKEKISEENQWLSEQREKVMEEVKQFREGERRLETCNQELNKGIKLDADNYRDNLKNWEVAKEEIKTEVIQRNKKRVETQLSELDQDNVDFEEVTRVNTDIEQIVEEYDKDSFEDLVKTISEVNNEIAEELKMKLLKMRISAKMGEEK